MAMHSVLFVVSVPSQVKWREFAAHADLKLRKYPGAFLRLGENVWLLNLQLSVVPLGQLIALADQFEVSYGILPFEHAPEWLPGGFDPKTIRGQIDH